MNFIFFSVIRGSIRSVPGPQSNADVYYNVTILDIFKVKKSAILLFLYILKFKLD